MRLAPMTGMKVPVIGVLWICLLVSSCVGRTEGDDAAAEGPARRQLGEDVFMSGSDVRLTQASNGDIVVAGGNVAVASPVAGDAVLAGGALELTGPVGGDVYVAGGRVKLDAKVAGHTRAAGGRVGMTPDTDLKGGVSIAAGEAEIEGTLRDYLTVAAGSTVINASIAGDVDVTSNSLELGPATVIHGSLTFRGPNPPDIAPEAHIAGTLRHIAPTEPPAWSFGAKLFGAALWVFGTALVGTVVLALWPGFTRSVSDLATRSTARGALTGIAVLLLGPVVSVVLFVSVIGVPLGLLVLYLYLLLLPLGYLASALAISDALLHRFQRHAERSLPSQVLMLLAVLVGLAVLISVPIAGKVLGAALVVLGMGCVALAITELFRRPSRRQGRTASQPFSEPRPLTQGG